MDHTPVIIYGRYSSKGQKDGSSIERQLEDARAHIARMGWTEKDVVLDEGKSAWKGDHLSTGNLGKLTSRIKAGMVPAGTVILVEKLDRLSRQKRRTTQRWLEDVTGLGIDIATVDGARRYSDASLTASMWEVVEILIKAELAWAESQQKSERTIDGLARKRAKAATTGISLSNRSPGWIRVEGDKRIAIPERADVVRLIYEWTADGMGTAVIAKRLNETLTPAWGGSYKAWAPTFVANIVTSPAVEGVYQAMRMVDGKREPLGDPIPDYYPVVVDPDLVARARAGRRSRVKTGGGHRHTHTNIFQGVIRCWACHAPMTLRNGPTKRASFECSNLYRGGGCTAKGLFRFRPFESRALDEILHLALDDSFFRQSDDSLAAANQVAGLEKLLADQKAKSARLVRLMISSDDPDPIMVETQADLTRTIATTRDRLREAVGALESARGGADALAHAKRVLEVREAIEDADPAIKAEARRRVSEAIRATVDRIFCRIEADGRLTYNVALVGGLVHFTMTTEGEIVAGADMLDRLADNPGLRRGVSHRPGLLEAVERRRAG